MDPRTYGLRAASGLLALTMGAAAIGGEVPFDPQLIISQNAVSARTAIAADVDGDGVMDVVTASLGDDKIAWHRNTGGNPPVWMEVVINDNFRDAREVFAIDMDFDGDMDVVGASRQDDTIAWFENLDGVGLAWAEHVVSAAVLSSWSAWAADIDGDGDLDVLSSGRDDNTISWHENTDGVGLTWTRRILTNTANRAQKAIAADVDADGDMDILSASGADDTIAWFENQGGVPPTFLERNIATNANNAKWVQVADIDQDGDLDVLSASEGDSAIRWYQNNGASPPAWTQHNVATNLGAKTVEPVDLDQDGDLDLISCGIGLDQISWHENLGGSPPAWTTRVISTLADNPLTVFPADIDGDGDPDIVSASFMDDEIAWYRNASIHRSARFPERRQIGLQNGAWRVAVADVNADGAPDVAAVGAEDNSVRLHLSNGDASPGFTPVNVTSNGFNPRDVVVADMDRDGDLDLLVAWEGSDLVALHRNDGAAIPTFTVTNVAVGMLGVRSVALGDINQDGLPDFVSASRASDRIAWHRNMGGNPPAFQTLNITTAADGAESVAVADLDGDGDLDVVSAWENADTVAWFENDGAPTPGWTLRTLAADADGAMHVAVADVDGDGDLDVVAGAANDNEVILFENMGGAPPTFMATTVDGEATGVQCVGAGDIDADGDVDIWAGAGTLDTVFWYENNGAPVPFFQRRVASDVTDFPRSVAAADIDLDGDLDFAVASRSDDVVAWLPNASGQFLLPGTDTAPETIDLEESDDVVLIEASHGGRPGDHSLRLTGAGVRIITAPRGLQTDPAPVDSALANILFSSISLRLDNGSGEFEPESDTPLVTLTPPFSLDAEGQVQFPIAGQPPEAVIIPGQVRRLYVVLEVAPDALDGSPRRIRVHHSAAFGASAVDVQAGVPLAPAVAPTLITEPVTLGTPCLGDVTGDGFVDFADLNLVTGTFNQMGPGVAGDVDGDGAVSFNDLNLVLFRYNQACP